MRLESAVSPLHRSRQIENPYQPEYPQTHGFESNDERGNTISTVQYLYQTLFTNDTQHLSNPCDQQTEAT